MKKEIKQYGNAPAVSTDPEMVVSVPLESFSHDSALSYPFYVKVNDQFVLFRTTGSSVTEKRASDLTAKFADVVYIHKTHWQEYLRNLEKTHLVSQKEGDSKSFEPQLNTRHLNLAYLKDIEEKHELFRHELKRYKAAAERLAFIVDSTPECAPSLIRRFHESSIYYANHSVNTAIYSLALGKKMGMELGELKTLSLAALFHNIGNLKVPKSILLDEKKLTSHQVNLFRMHTLKGLELLEKAKLPKTITRVAAEHHECYDGSGYPLGMNGQEMTLFSRICSLCDVYDELQSVFLTNEPKEFKAAQSHLKANEKKFDPKILPLLLSFDF